MTAATETRAKYTDAEIEEMGKKGQAFKNPDGHYSYPVKDAGDLDNAIKAVGRGGAGHDAIRKYIIGRARALGLSSQIPGNWNADGSLGGQSSAPRPDLELLKRRRCSMIRQRERRGLPFASSGEPEMRAKPDGTGGTKYEFRGYASTFGDWFTVWDKWNDEYEESVRPGGFSETLAGAFGGPDVRFYIGHDESGLALARTAHGRWDGTMRLLQDSRGLEVSAPDLDGRNSEVRNMYSAIERGDVDGMSIGFVTRGQEWSDDYMRRTLTSLDLHNGDVSVVSVPANPNAVGATMIPLSPGGGMSLSRQAAEERAARGEELMMKGTRLRLPMIDAALDQAQAIFGKADLSALPPDIGQAIELVGSAGIHVDHILKHEGLPDPDKGASSGWSAGNPAAEERAARGEINDNSNQPDFNLPGPAYDPAGHGPESIRCPSDSCPVYASGDGPRALNAKDAKYCDQCGGALYGEDGRLVLDDNGVVTEVGGALADADLLSRRLRLLELA